MAVNGVNGNGHCPPLNLKAACEPHLHLTLMAHQKLKALRKRGELVINGNDLDVSSIVAVTR